MHRASEAPLRSPAGGANGHRGGRRQYARFPQTNTGS